MKKIVPIVLCLCLIFAISARATAPDSTTSETPAPTAEMPMQGRGGRGGMMQGQRPAMPETGMFEQGQMRRDIPPSTEVQAPTSPSGALGFMQTYSTPITSVLLLLAAFVFVILYKRKQY